MRSPSRSGAFAGTLSLALSLAASSAFAGGPPIGACCKEVPGIDPPFICMPATLQQCEAQGGTWYGPGSSCADLVCLKPCVSPPWGMVAWWPFDEIAGPIADDLTVMANNGIFMPAGGGPIPIPGVVGPARRFDGIDDKVAVPPDPSLDFACKGFTVDLWVRRAAPSANAGLVNLVAHYGTLGGWIFGLDESTGLLQLVSESNCLRCIANSTVAVPVNVWTHVAVTLSGCDCEAPCGASGRTVTFYVNGAAAGSSGAGCCDLSSNSGPVGVTVAGAVWISGWYHGDMDEIEVFCRELEPMEIASIAAAGSSGKCKDTCHASWDRQGCIDSTTMTAPAEVTICNYSATPKTYSWVITPNPNCGVTGLVFTPSSGVVVVGPGLCVTTLVNVNASGASGLGLACYNVTIVNLESGQPCSTMGSVKVLDCVDVVFPCDPVVFPQVFDGLPIGFDIVSSTEGGGLIPFQIMAMPSDMSSEERVVSLNGLPPGTRYIGNIVIPPGGKGFVPVEVRFTAPDSFAFHDVIFLADLDGDGVDDAVSSIGVKQIAASCLGDLNDDGIVNSADLGLLLSAWDTPNADLNGDGTTNGADLGLMLGVWGPCG